MVKTPGVRLSSWSIENCGAVATASFVRMVVLTSRSFRAVPRPTLTVTVSTRFSPASEVAALADQANDKVNAIADAPQAAAMDVRFMV